MPGTVSTYQPLRRKRFWSPLLSWPCPVCSRQPPRHPLHGYVPATGTEVLLLLFLGDRGAAQLVTDQHRGSHHAPPGAAIELAARGGTPVRKGLAVGPSRMGAAWKLWFLHPAYFLFVRMLSRSRPSTCGMTQLVLRTLCPRTVCGEQGGPLMPALYSLGQHPMLAAGERMAAFLDDTYALTTSERAGPAFQVLARHSAEHCHIQLNQRKACAWNAVRPTGSLPQSHRGWLCQVCVWVHMLLREPSLQSRTNHDELPQRLPELEGLQASWPLLLFCCLIPTVLASHVAPVCNTCAGEHDKAIVSALANLLGRDGIPHPACAIARLQLSLGDFVARWSAPAPLAPCLRAASSGGVASCEVEPARLARRRFTTVPTCPALAYSSGFFRVPPAPPPQVLLPVSSLSGPSWRPPCCLRAIRVLRGQRCPLERCAARVCHEAGARVTCNTRDAERVFFDSVTGHLSTSDISRLKSGGNGRIGAVAQRHGSCR